MLLNPKNPPRDRGYATLERSGHADRAPDLLTYLLMWMGEAIMLDRINKRVVSVFCLVSVFTSDLSFVIGVQANDETR